MEPRARFSPAAAAESPPALAMDEAALSLSPLPGDGVWILLTRHSVPIVNVGARAYVARCRVFCACSRLARHARHHPRFAKSTWFAALCSASRGMRRKQIDSTHYLDANQVDKVSCYVTPTASTAHAAATDESQLFLFFGEQHHS